MFVRAFLVLQLGLSHILDTERRVPMPDRDEIGQAFWSRDAHSRHRLDVLN
jgi:hypothetical protein